ncbi:MAG: hypothetical protein J6R42_01410 [Clostridia bacterium]|nr:hypothetical protein [Clostridia bacterium]
MKRYLYFEILLPIVAALFTITITTLRVLAFLFDYDVAAGYFSLGSQTFRAANILSIVYLVACFVVVMIFCHRRLIPSKDTLFSRILALGLGVGLVLFIASQISSGFPDGRMGVCLLISVIFATGGLLFCILTFIPMPWVDPARALSALSLVGASIFYAMSRYFNPALPINSDIKNIYIFASLGAMLFFLSEAKRVLGKPISYSSRFFNLSCFMFSISAGVPELVDAIVSNDAPIQNYTHALLQLLIGAYAFARLLASRIPVAADAEPIGTMEEAAQVPQAEAIVELEAQAEDAQDE